MLKYNFRLGHNGAPFEAKIRIPRMNIDARYVSSGVLIILPASGNGTFNARMGKCYLFFFQY
jgi:hypothetical protein